MRSALLLLALSFSALAARPVARPLRGSLDERIVTHDAVGVLVQFEGVTKADAQRRLDLVASQRSLSGGLRVGFVKTPKATLAALYVVAPGALTVGRLKQLALACSLMEGAKASWAFVHPGPTSDDLEVESFWRFEAGRQVAEKRLAFRDDEAWGQWNRRRLSHQQLELKKWPGWPLSELAITLGLPGRDFLQRPLGLLDLSTWAFPDDVGANQVLTLVYLPEATVLEIRQEAEHAHASPSRLVEDALSSADKAKTLGVQAAVEQRAPWDEEMPDAAKSVARELPLFLSREVWGLLEGKADAESLSNSKIVEYAWRHSHPSSDPKKKKK